MDFTRIDNELDTEALFSELFYHILSLMNVKLAYDETNKIIEIEDRNICDSKRFVRWCIRTYLPLPLEISVAMSCRNQHQIAALKALIQSVLTETVHKYHREADIFISYENPIAFIQ